MTAVQAPFLVCLPTVFGLQAKEVHCTMQS